ncbi:23 kDa integral membrane protein-like isoform X1 [Tribolium madens]|uniref:23 kDa integral membrane protein-like isoform X1 n=1 Tax=Tribolium madens TaxID=41895 RepID=UPI001CF73BAF|nr:23 kDa integral membrane protein-like isoform X1 [Tribolium madens]
MGCATGIVKYFVFLANLVFALAGLALVIIGVLYKFNYSEATDALPSNFGVAPILSIIIGAIVFVTAFLGCCGAVKESPCMLTTYAIILLVIFIIQVAIGVYAFIKINEDEAEPRSLIHESLAKTFKEYGNDVKKTEAVDAIQSWFHCCGLDRYDHMVLHNGSLPHSCCRDGVSVCRPTNYNSFYDKSCSKALMEFYQKSSPIIGGVAIGIAVIEIIGAVFGLCLSSSIRNQYRRSAY